MCVANLFIWTAFCCPMGQGESEEWRLPHRLLLFPLKDLGSSQVLGTLPPRSVSREPAAGLLGLVLLGSDVGTFKPGAVECKRESKRCRSLREKPSLHLRWKQHNNKTRENPKIMHAVFLLGRTPCTFSGPCLSQQAIHRRWNWGPRWPAPLRPNIVVNKVICFSWCLPKRLGWNHFHSQNNDLLEAEKNARGKAGSFDLLFCAPRTREGSNFWTNINA